MKRTEFLPWPYAWKAKPWSWSLLVNEGASQFWEVEWEQTRTNMSAKVCNWSRVVDFLTTFSQLSHNFLTTFSQLSSNFFTTFSQLSHNFLTTFTQLCYNFLVTFLQISHNFLSPFSKPSHNFCTTFLQFFFTIFSQISHNFLSTFSQFSHNVFTTLQHFHHFLTTLSQLSHNFLIYVYICIDGLQVSWKTFNFLNRPWFVLFRPLFIHVFLWNLRSCKVNLATFVSSSISLNLTC